MTVAPRVKISLVVILSVAVATALRFSLGLLWPELHIFGFYYVATLFVTVTCGVRAGLIAAPLGIVTGWWFFVPPPYAFFPVPDDALANVALSFFLSAAIVAIAARE